MDDNDTWHSRALCKQHDPDIWFYRNTYTARKICAVCPVTHECLEEALSFPQYLDNFGIRAGLSARARMLLRQSRQVQNTIVN